MFDKIVRSMFHGSPKTKLFLWTVFILGLAALGMLSVAIALGLPMLGAGAIGLGLVSFITSQSVSIDTLEKNHQLKKKKEELQREKDCAHPQEKERMKARFLASLNEKSVRKILKDHKVKQNHVKVMIDSYEERKLKQVPAFLWRTDKSLHFLVLEGHANEFEIPLDQIHGIYYEKNIDANPEKEYVPFRYGTFIAKMFSGYLPEYFEKSQGGELFYQKNLFRLEPGIYITNSSVANVMSILPRVPFLIDDEVCRTDRFDEYFKEIYRYSILCKNMVISLEQYKEQTEKTLEALLHAPISTSEFVNSLKAMSHYRLISREYVVRYTQRYREMKKI